MITKIVLNRVTSYKNPTTLETDKKVNLIYGLKGIFTLSKENKEAEQKIRIAEKEIKKLEEEQTKKSNTINILVVGS